MAETAKLIIGDVTYELPIVIGSEGERAVDITSLRQSSGFITLDPGYANTGSCKSAITFVNGEKGVLRYRGYPIEILAEQSSFIETAMLLLFGELPTSQERGDFRTLLGEQEFLHTDLMHHFEGFPASGSPMAILSAVINSLGTFSPDLYEVVTPSRYRLAAAKLISKVRTIAAFSYRKSIGRPIIYPNTRFGYCHNFLHMMFSIPFKVYEPPLEARSKPCRSSSSCTPTTSRTAPAPPCAWSAPPAGQPLRLGLGLGHLRPVGAPCTAARTRL